MRNVLALFPLGKLDLALGDGRTRDRRAHEVNALVLAVGLQHGVDIVLNQRLAQVLDKDLSGAGAHGLLLSRLKVLLLADIALQQRLTDA